MFVIYEKIRRIKVMTDSAVIKRKMFVIVHWLDRGRARNRRRRAIAMTASGMEATA